MLSWNAHLSLVGSSQKKYVPDIPALLQKNLSAYMVRPVVDYQAIADLTLSVVDSLGADAASLGGEI